MRKQLLALLLVLVLALTACTAAPAPSVEPTVEPTATAAATVEATATPEPEAAQPISVTDDTGAAYEFEQAPTRVIVMDPSMAEIYYALGAQDTLVAVGSYADYPAEVAEKTKVGAYSKMNVEELIALTPDLIIMGRMASDPAQADALNNANIPTLILNATTIEETYINIEKIGTLMDRAAEAETVIAAMKDGLAAIAEKAKGQTEKRAVYIEISPLESGLYAPGSKTFQHELIELIGAENIFASEEGWPAVSEEQVIERNPDVIISTTQYEGYDPIADITARKGWEKIAAVEGGQVYFLDNALVSRAAPRLVEGAQALYDTVYGD